MHSLLFMFGGYRAVIYSFQKHLLSDNYVKVIVLDHGDTKTLSKKFLTLSSLYSTGEKTRWTQIHQHIFLCRPCLIGLKGNEGSSGKNMKVSETHAEEFRFLLDLL